MRGMGRSLWLTVCNASKNSKFLDGRCIQISSITCIVLEPFYISHWRASKAASDTLEISSNAPDFQKTRWSHYEMGMTSKWDLCGFPMTGVALCTGDHFIFYFGFFLGHMVESSRILRSYYPWKRRSNKCTSHYSFAAKNRPLYSTKAKKRTVQKAFMGLAH